MLKLGKWEPDSQILEHGLIHEDEFDILYVTRITHPVPRGLWEALELVVVSKTSQLYLLKELCNGAITINVELCFPNLSAYPIVGVLTLQENQ